MRSGGAFATSVLTRVECLRALDRIRLNREASEAEFTAWRGALDVILGMCEMVEIDARILGRAAEPLPSVLGSLDAIHLASAMRWREDRGAELLLVTHDHALARAARLMGIEVTGAPA